MENPSQLNIAKRLQNEARKDRAKLVSGAAILAVAILGITSIVYINVQDWALGLGIIASAALGLFVCAVLLALKLIKKMEFDSMGEGVHLVINSLPIAGFMLDKDAKVVDCNEATLKLYGFSSKEEYNEKFITLFPEFQPDGKRSMEVMDERMKGALEQGTQVFEWWDKFPNGEMLPTRITLVRAYFGSEDHVLTFIEDLREVYGAKKREQVFRERMQAIMDAVPLLCVLYDENSNIIDINKEAQNLFGIADKQIFADNFTAFLPEYQPDGSRSYQKGLDTIRDTLRDGYRCYEWVFQHSDGTPVPTEANFHRITVDGKNFVISFSRDLRGQYEQKKKENLIQEQIGAISEQLNAHVVEQAAAVTESAAATEQMIANVQSVTNSLSKNTQHVKDLQTASEVGHSGLSEVATDIREIANESESLLEINSVMQNISSQTNLLSMNAAIEAAHAGESGRGFAVVADEIRKLAESSGQQSKTIGVVLKRIKEEIDKITKSTENVLNKFDAIDSRIKTVAEQERTVLNAMEEQGKGSLQMLQAIGQLNDITQGVKNEALQMVESSRRAIQGE